MLIGYNQSRPNLKNYLDFEEKLITGLKDLNIDGLSLMIYGSYIRGDMDIGRSDIDAVMTFPCNFIINKDDLQSVGKVLHKALKNNNVPFQVNVTDISTLSDGRFNSYDESFKDYFDKEARIIGPDYRPQIKYELPTMNEQVPVRFNLRKTRNGLLFAEHDMNEDYESYLRKFSKSLDAVSRGSKQVIHFIDGNLRTNRFAVKDLMIEYLPNIDNEPLLKIKQLYHNPNQLDELYKKPDEVLKLWNESVTFFEQMIKGYIEMTPRKSL